MNLLDLLIVLNILCQGSNVIDHNRYETDCQTYYISCDKDLSLCELKHSTLFEMQPSPIQRF